MDAYVHTLETKLTELTGLKINQMHSSKSEEKEIEVAAEFIKNLKVAHKAETVAPTAQRNPIISKVLDCIKNETGEVDQFKLPPLPYAYDALHSVIHGVIMRIHHDKHHNGYVNNLNNAVKLLREAEANGDTKAINQLTGVILFNGGGHLNHTIYWQNMAPMASGGGKLPAGDLRRQIEQDFGDFDSFKTELSTKASGLEGSGWGWLGWCPQDKKLKVVTCQNHDPVETTHGLFPLLVIDVWEHAYYLQYKNLRANYVENFFKIVNWEDVATRLKIAKRKMPN